MVGRIVLAFVCCAATQSAAEGLAARLFPDAAGRCYQRTYDAGHLRQHPVQQVRRIAVSADPRQPDDPTLMLRLQVWTRDAELPAKARVWCTEYKGKLDCALDKGQGFFTLETARNGAVMLRPSSDEVSLRAADGFVVMRGNSGDDREFLLPVSTPEFCRG